MSRAELLAAAAAAHFEWCGEHGDSVPLVPEDSVPHHRGGRSDYAEHAADRSAPSDVDDLLSGQLAALLEQHRTADAPAGPVRAAAIKAGSPEQIQAQWEAARAAILEAWPKTAAPMVAELADQAEAAVADRDLPRLGQLAVSAGVIAAQAAMLGKGSSRLARQAADGVVAEAAAYDVAVEPGDAGVGKVRATAEAVAHIIAAGYASGAGRIALQHAGADPQSVRDAVERHLDGLSTAERGMVADQMGALLSAAQHAGRLAVLESAPKGTTFRASERNDPSRCDECDAVDGRTYRTLREALADYPSAGFKSCEGMSRCRGFIAADWRGKRRS